MRMVYRRVGAVLLAAGCVTLASCGGRYEPIPETGATLEGTVTYKGEKVGAALIILAGTSGGAQGTVGDDGRYKIENAPLGEVKIGVNTAAAKGMAMGRAAGQHTKAAKLLDVPGQYADPIKSGITTTVQKGNNTFDIAITK